jgi:hypothetical protein
MATETASIQGMGSRRGFTTSHAPGYIGAATLGQNRKCSLQVQHRSNTKKLQIDK